jgi:hypothetical protein
MSIEIAGERLPEGANPVMRSEQSRRAFVEVGRLILAMLQERAPGGAIPQELEEVISFEERIPLPRGTGGFIGPSWGKSFRRKFAAGRIRIARADELYAIPDLRSAMHAFWESGDAYKAAMANADGSPILAPTFEQGFPALVDLMLTLAHAYVNRYGTFDLDEGRLELTYQAHRHLQTADRTDWVVAVPLLGFESEASPVEVAEGVVIREFTAEEKTRIWRRGGFSGFMGFQAFLYCGFYVEHRYHKLRADPPHVREIAAKKVCIRVLNALRLLHAGHFAAPAKSTRHEWPVVEEGPGQVSDLEQWDSRDFPFNPYLLRVSEVDELRSIYEQLERAEAHRSNHAFDIPLGRFNMSYARQSAEDKIVDLTVALESSLLFGLTEELSYRLSIRGATLLRRIRDAGATMHFLKDLYTVRSAVVHEGASLQELSTRKGKKAIFERHPHTTIAKEAEECVRQVLSACIALAAEGKSLSDIVRELDEHIVKQIGQG